MSHCRPVDRQTGFLLPSSVDDWLPEKHLARDVVEVIDQLDTRAMQHAYRGAGSARDHPTMLLGWLVYGYANGVYSSRKMDAPPTTRSPSGSLRPTTTLTTTPSPPSGGAF